MKAMKNIPRLIMFAVLTLIAIVFVIPIDKQGRRCSVSQPA